MHVWCTSSLLLFLLFSLFEARVVHVTSFYKYSCSILIEGERAIENFETLIVFFLKFLCVKHRVAERFTWVWNPNFLYSFPIPINPNSPLLFCVSMSAITYKKAFLISLDNLLWRLYIARTVAIKHVRRSSLIHCQSATV